MNPVIALFVVVMLLVTHVLFVGWANTKIRRDSGDVKRPYKDIRTGVCANDFAPYLKVTSGKYCRRFSRWKHNCVFHMLDM